MAVVIKVKKRAEKAEGESVNETANTEALNTEAQNTETPNKTVGPSAEAVEANRIKQKMMQEQLQAISNLKIYILSEHLVLPLKELAERDSDSENLKAYLAQHPTEANMQFAGQYRVLGVFKCFEEARAIIEKNKGDICGNNSYNVACIEKTDFGLNRPVQKRWFFSMEFGKDENGKLRYKHDKLTEEDLPCFNESGPLGIA